MGGDARLAREPEYPLLCELQRVCRVGSVATSCLEWVRGCGGRVTCLEGARLDCQETTGRRCLAVSRGDSKSRPIEARAYASSFLYSPLGGFGGVSHPHMSLYVHMNLGTPLPIPNSEVKQVTAGSVLWCENTREAPVTQRFYLISFPEWGSLFFVVDLCRCGMADDGWCGFL